MFIADFHIHSKYSRATSKDCVPEKLELWARLKGLDLIGTGDFTHAQWRRELKEKLIPGEEGLYALKDECRLDGGGAKTDSRPRFVISGEISSIYKKNGRVRKVHNVIVLPGLEAAEKLSRRLETIGNLHSDGRPILGLDSRDLLEITLETAPDAIFIPAHIWTPHFSLFGAYSGFDDIRECFGDLTEHIHALETGLSSDPPMNWRVSALDSFTLVSNSDAHSPAKLAREANLFDAGLSYPDIARALDKSTDGFRGTIEFFPEEGKYHYDGHRKCSVCQKPAETNAASGKCPVCGGRITVGVLHRVEELADRKEEFIPKDGKPFESLVPLQEIIACAMGMTVASKKVASQYFELLQSLGPELYILREAPLEDVSHKAGALLAEGIRRLRQKEVEIQPGYDGEYGKIKIFDEGEISLLSGQISFFGGGKEQKNKTSEAPKKKERAAAPSMEQPTGIEKAGGSLPPSADISYGLNREQWEAVSASEGAVAVVAGPGTGKTRTLVSRIAYLVEKCGVNPSHITAVTFTNKAAGEMRARLEDHFSDGAIVKGMAIGTFHSICLRLLQEAGSDATVIDGQNALGIMDGILKQSGIKSSPRDVLRAISLIKNGAAAGDDDAALKARDMYDEALTQYGAMDFDDILVRALALSGENGAKDVPAFRHILVDEFQDINPVQYRLIKAWGRGGGDIFVIGDPDQSIYGFRGSDPGFFDSFFDEFSPVRRIRLMQNYRSTPEILGCAQLVVKSASRLSAIKESGAKVRLLTARDAFSEALFVAKEINRMVGGMDMLEAHAYPASGAAAAKRGFSDIAVLYRTNRQAYALEQCLKKEDIPYIVAGRDDFLSDPQVRSSLAFFRFLINPCDILSLKAYLEIGIQPAELAKKILADYAASGKGLDAMTGILVKAGSDIASEIPALSQRIAKYSSAVSREKPYKLIEDWARDNGIDDNPGMELFINTSVMYKDMPAFLKNLTLGQDSDVVRSGRRSYSPDAVSLMTLHCSKGLEYPAVFMCGVSDGLVPLRNREGICDEKEERRLFYVGMTRAREELILLTSSAGSPFVSGFPKEFTASGSVKPKPRPGSKQLSIF